jgi:translocation and assembly module TamB
MFSLLALLIAVGIYVLLHSARVHAYLLRTTQEKATQALGSEVHIKDYVFHWSGFGPSVELYGIVVNGAHPYEQPPLLQADSLRVQVTISSLWHRSWYVNDVQVAHPVLRVFTDAQGRMNLPQPTKPAPASQNKFDVFKLGVRHITLTQGEIDYNNRKSDLTADLHDLALQIDFSTLQQQYSGTLSYRDGHIQWAGVHPITHSLDVRFTATAAHFNLDNLTLHTQGSQLSLQADIENYADPFVRAEYEANLDCGEFRRVLKNNSLLAGIVHLSGSADYKNREGQPLLANITLHGDLHSAELSVPNPQLRTKIRNVSAQYSLANGDAKVTEARAELLGGTLAATLNVRDLAGRANSNLNATLKNISVADAQKLLASSSSQYATLHGAANATVDAVWVKAFDNLTANADATINANMQAAPQANSTPVDGIIHASYNSPRQTLALRQSSVKTAQTTISLDGVVSRNSSVQVRIASGDLHELEEIASGFRAPNVPLLGLHGQATLIANVTGPVQAPQIRGQLNASNLSFRGTSWKLLRTQFTASPSAISLDSGELDPASKGRITFQIGADLRQWTFGEAQQFHTNLQARDLDAAELAKAAGQAVPVSGSLSLSVQAHGTRLQPVGEGKIEFTHAVVAGEPLKSAQVGFQANGSAITAQARIDLAAGSATADLKYAPKQQAYEIAVHSNAIELDQLEVLKAKNLGINGVLKVDASGKGTLQNPELHAALEIPQLSARGQSLNDLKFTADIADQSAKFNFSSAVLNTQAAGHGTIQLNGDYPADIALDTQSIPLQPVFAMLLPEEAQDLTGQTEIHATLRGPLKNKSAVEAHLVVPQFKVSYKNSIQLAAAEPIRADYTNGTLSVKRSALRGTGTDLTFEASLPVASENPISVLLQGTVDLQLAQLFDPDLTAGGQLRFDINSAGQRSDPNIQGQIRIVNASFSEAGTPVGLQNGNGTLTLTRDRLNVTEFKGEVGGGTVSASGGIAYRPNLRFDLAMKADDVRILYAQSIRAAINSDLTLAGQYDNALLGGRVSIEQLSFTSNFDLMNLASQFGGGETTPPPTGGFIENLHLQVGVTTPGGLSLTSRELSVAGSVNMQVRGSASQPVLLGRINLTDGDLIFYGNRYLVQGGTIDFRNPSRTDPVVNISANTNIQQYDIQMHFWGPADHLHTNYSSDPALPPSDIINLIAFGKTSEASAANPTPPGTLGAQSLVASQVSSQVTSRIAKVAGISQLSVDPELGSGQQNSGAQITIQQRVTGKIFVTFSTDVTATQQEIIQVEYQLNSRASLKAVRDQNGGFSFETSFKKNW